MFYLKSTFHILTCHDQYDFPKLGSDVKTDLKSYYVECTKHDVVLHNFLQRAKLLSSIIFKIETTVNTKAIHIFTNFPETCSCVFFENLS
jgi:hypothetical protein